MRKLLFLASRFPYPPIGGDRLKNYNLLKILSKYFEVYLVVITFEDVKPEDIAEIKKYVKQLFVFRYNKFFRYFAVLKSFFNKLPIQVNLYYFAKVAKFINAIVGKNEFSMIWATLIRTAHYVIKINKIKILDIADSIGQNYTRSIKTTKSFVWKLVYFFEAKRLLEYEKECVKRFDKSLFFNKHEAVYYRNQLKVAWIPHGVNEKLFLYEKVDDKYSKYIAFFGKMDYQPNIDAVLWFVENVFPKINKDLKFIIVGANPSRRVLKLSNKFPNVEVTGFVKDPYKILKACLCIVAPMQTGGGIQNKILETMALGTINIVSSLAAKPIMGVNSVDFFVVDEPEKIASLINRIYERPERFNYIKKNARDFVRKNFTWSIYEYEVIKIINEVLGYDKS